MFARPEAPWQARDLVREREVMLALRKSASADLPSPETAGWCLAVFWLAYEADDATKLAWPFLLVGNGNERTLLKLLASEGGAPKTLSRSYSALLKGLGLTRDRWSWLLKRRGRRGQEIDEYPPGEIGGGSTLYFGLLAWAYEDATGVRPIYPTEVDGTESVELLARRLPLPDLAAIASNWLKPHERWLTGTPKPKSKK